MTPNLATLTGKTNQIKFTPINLKPKHIPLIQNIAPDLPNAHSHLIMHLVHLQEPPSLNSSKAVQKPQSPKSLLRIKAIS